MIWFLAIATFAAFVWLGRRVSRQPNEWRTAAGVIGTACIVAGAAAAVRGLTVAGVLIMAVGLSLILIARRTPLGFGPMTEAQARKILGVEEGASEAEIQSAYRTRMRTAHPDQGGSADAAARLNAARDRLIRKR